MPGYNWKKSSQIAKRAIDLLGSGIGLILLAPLFLVVGILIKLDSRGPILHRGWRIGRHSRRFKIFKFRTMVNGADKLGSALTTEKDERLTRLGGFFRRSKIDELPQLINVLLGQMSLVGPRPESPCYVEHFSADEKRLLLSVRPGITDLASIQFHNYEKVLQNRSDIEKYYLENLRPEKSRLQLEYLKNISVKKDLGIIFQTLKTVYASKARKANRPPAPEVETQSMSFAEVPNLHSAYKRK